MQLRQKSLRNHALVLGAAVVALLAVAGPAAADSSQYPSPLYLSGTASSILGGSYQLVTSQGLSANAVGSSTWGLTWGVASPQVALTGAVGSDPGPSTGLGLSGSESYSYRYTEVDAGGETVASVASNTVSAHQQDITVSGLPTGYTVKLYRLNSVGAYKLVTTLTNNSSSTYLDKTPDTSVVTVLPQAQNRANLSGAGSAIGYYDFSPGAALSNPNVTNGNANPSTPPASAAFNGKGWILDGAGGVAFPAASATTPWQFTTKLSSSGSTSATAGTAHLVIGMWIVDGSGNVVGSPLIDPTCVGSPCGENSSYNIALGSGTSAAIVSTFTTVPSFTIPSGDHLYVQFFRRQTAAAFSGSTIVTMNAYDNVAAITHPAATTLPTTPTLVMPTAAADTNSDALTGTFSDPDAGDTGALTFNVCSDSACSSIVTSGTSSTVANGANASWTPTSLADGTYWWRAQATDAVGGQSSWTTPQTFTFDTTPPDTTIGTGPADPNNSTSATFSFSSTESGSTFQCQLDGGGYSTCTSPKTYNALADGSHTFDVKATDAASNTDPTPAPATWTINTVAPATTISAAPANLTNATSASFSFGANQAGSTFQCKLDGGGYSTCTSPSTYSGLAAGTHTFEVEATDTAGNTGSASFSWTVDTTPPETTIGTGPATLVNSASAAFAFSSTKTGSTFQCQLDGGGYSACTSPQNYSGLVDGSHTFDVEATDAAGNTDPTPAAATWTVDTTAPDTTITSRPPNPMNAASASFSFASNDNGATFTCSLDGAGYSACTSPMAYGGLADGSHTFDVEATDAAGNTDPTPAAATWTVDTTPPGAPGSLAGSTGAGGLALSWTAPGGEPIGEYVVYVNGIATVRIGGGTTTTNITDFAEGDTVAVSAVDEAGNEGPRSAALTAVPDLIGLTLWQASATLQAQGFAIGNQGLNGSDSARLVISQQPAAGTLASAQSGVLLALGISTESSGSGTSVAKVPLAVHIAGARALSCTQSGELALHLKLDRKANVAVRFLTTAGVSVGSMKLVSVEAGAQTLTLHLPLVLAKGKSYRLIVTASIKGQIVKDEIRVTITRVHARTTASARTCG
jgi:PASTA domain